MDNAVVKAMCIDVYSQSPVFTTVAMLLLAYILGCISWAYYLVKWRKNGVDIRECASGTAGATNAGRVLGREGFLLVLFLDGLKGFLAVLIPQCLGCPPLIYILAISVCVFGHIFPIQLKFRGGKGIAPAIGGILAASPILFIVLVLGWGILFAILRKYRLSGIIILFSLIPLSVLLLEGFENILGMTVLAILLLGASLWQLLGASLWQRQKGALQPEHSPQKTEEKIPTNSDTF